MLTLPWDEQAARTSGTLPLAYAPEPQQHGTIPSHRVRPGSLRERAVVDDIAHDLATIGASYDWAASTVPTPRGAKAADGRAARGFALYEAGWATCYLSKYLSVDAKSGVPRAGNQRPRAEERGVRPDALGDAHALHHAQPAEPAVRVHRQRRAATDARRGVVATRLLASLHGTILPPPPEHAVGAARCRRRVAPASTCLDDAMHDGSDGTAARPCPRDPHARAQASGRAMGASPLAGRRRVRARASRRAGPEGAPPQAT
jgi:hypothetical protein